MTNLSVGRIQALFCVCHEKPVSQNYMYLGGITNFQCSLFVMIPIYVFVAFSQIQSVGLWQTFLFVLRFLDLSEHKDYVVWSPSRGGTLRSLGFTVCLNPSTNHPEVDHETIQSQNIPRFNQRASFACKGRRPLSPDWGTSCNRNFLGRHDSAC